MFVAMGNADLVGKLLKLAGDDIDLVQVAVRAAANGNKAADLERVVDLIVQQKNATRPCVTPFR